MQINEAKFKKNIAIGVTLPKEGQIHPEVLQQLASYRKYMRLYVLISLLLLMIATIVTLPKHALFVNFTLLFLMIIAPMGIFAWTNHKLLAIKRKQGWSRFRKNKVVKVDTVTIEETKWLSPLVFVPPFVRSLLPVLFQQRLWEVYLGITFTTVIYYLSYRYLYRNKAERVDDNASLTAALTRMRRYNWGKVWISLAWSNPLLG